MTNIRLLLIAVGMLCLPPGLFTVKAALPAAGKLSVMATLSRRSARPGTSVELVVTVRAAKHPSILVPQDLEGLRFRRLKKPRLLQVDEEDVWLFRYRVVPTQVGEYQIPPLRVIDGNDSAESGPLFLHVSSHGEAPPLSPGELALGVNIPESLSREVLKNAPQPLPKPEPSPSPRDSRPWTEQAASGLWNGLQAFWNYPGK